MYLCGFGAEWLFASIFTYFVISFYNTIQRWCRAEQPELDSAADLYGAVYRPVREKGFSKPYILALGIVIFAVLLYTSLWFFHLPSGLATVLMFGITVLFGLGTGGGLLYTLDRLHLPGRCR